MDQFLQMNIFFVVTTVAVVAVAILFIVLLVRLIQISSRIRDEIDMIRTDINELRQSLRQGGTFIKHLFGLVRNFGKKTKK